ncbi:MFS transporter [Pyrodictium abyssi]|uniref:MFS transporter n=1 Tax=Pyrodictium abyssi TaxID=54256 RepID=A0ABN6ZMR5_9CREN|nr:MFS transporter [Pyrodictium abyssi]
MAAVFAASVAAGLSRLALAKYMRDDLGASALIVSSLTTWFMAARAFSSVASGLVADASPAARRLLATAPLAVIAALVYTIPSLASPLAILALNAAWGLLSGMVWPVAQTMAALAAGRQSATVMSVYFAAGSLGVSLGQYLYGLLPLGNPDAVRLSALLFAASAALLIPAVRSMPAPPARPRARGSRSQGLLASLCSDGLAAWILLSALSAGYLSGLLREFLYIYLGEVYGLDRQSLASSLAAAGLAAFAAGLAVGPLADRLGVAPVLAAVLAMGLAGSLALGLSPVLSAALLGLALAMTAARSSLPLTRNAAAFAPGLQATLVGASNALSNIGQMASPVIAGRLYDALRGETLAGLRGEAIPFLTAAALLAATLTMSPLARRKGP